MEQATSDNKARIAEADRIIRNYALGSVAMGAIPAPGVDLVALTSVQMKMLHSLCKLYNISFANDLSRNAIASLITGFVPVVSRMAVSSVIKAIPLVGQMASMLTMPALSGATSYAIGNVFKQHFESGGTFLTFDPEKVRGYFEEQFKAGKDFVANANSEDKAKAAEVVAGESKDAV